MPLIFDVHSLLAVVRFSLAYFAYRYLICTDISLAYHLLPAFGVVESPNKKVLNQAMASGKDARPTNQPFQSTPSRL